MAANYCPRCHVTWPGVWFEIGAGVFCPMPRPKGIATLYGEHFGWRCGTMLIEAPD